jgi:hypothetical protein
MLRIIPTITAEGVHDYFNHVIDAKLTVYENLKDTPALLELAIWKSKITEQVGLCPTHHRDEDATSH